MPVHFQEPPGGEGDRFQDRPDFAQELYDALGAFTRIGVQWDPESLGAAAVEYLDEVTFNVNVTIAAPELVAPSDHPASASGEAAAVFVVRRALDQLGYDAETARIDRTGVTELEDRPTS